MFKLSLISDGKRKGIGYCLESFRKPYAFLGKLLQYLGRSAI